MVKGLPVTLLCLFVALIAVPLWAGDTPVMPVALTSDWNLITRPVIPIFISQPYPDPEDSLQVQCTTGFGDIVWMEMVSPSPAVPRSARTCSCLQ